MTNILKLKQFVLLSGDILLVLSSLPITLIIAFGEELNRDTLKHHFLPFSLIYAFLLVVFYINGLYEIRSFTHSSAMLAKLVISHTAAFVFGIIIFYFSLNPQITPKTNLVISMLSSLVLVGLWRLFFQRFLTKYFRINIAVAGVNEHTLELINVINSKPYVGYKLKAVVKTNTLSEIPIFENYNEIKTFYIGKDLASKLISENISTVITSENPHLNPFIAKAFYECIPYRIRFLDLADTYEVLTGRIPISYITQAWFLENINEQQKRLYTNLKRVIDIASALIILVLTFWLWPLIALLIKFDTNGPVFYTQERVGYNKRIFKLIKFRSMIESAEINGPIWAQKNDPRVTRVGKYLRRTHLDELPQMLNVLMSDISLVGPRPERIEFVKELETEVPHYNVRHIIKPGFTGWAQVNYRYARTPEDTYEKFQYDLYYLKNRSLILDISIILKTISLFFKNEK